MPPDYGPPVRLQFGSSQLPQQFERAATQERMHRLRRDLRQRLEHEAPAMYLRMRDLQPRSIQHAAAVQDNIQIDAARPFRDEMPAALTAHRALQRQE